MPRHPVGDFEVEVLHRKDALTGRMVVAIYVFRGRRFIERADFWYNEFNTADLRRKARALAAFPVRAFDAVVEDAREWPKAKPSSSMKAMGRKKTIRKTGKR